MERNNNAVVNNINKIDILWSRVNSLFDKDMKFVIDKILILATNDFLYAGMLSQLIYWLKRTKGQDGWVYKSFEDWNNEFCGVITRRIRDGFNKLPFILTKIKKANGDPTTYYNIDVELLWDTIEKAAIKLNSANGNVQNVQNRNVQNVQNEMYKMSNSLTEITTNKIHDQKPKKSTLTEQKFEKFWQIYPRKVGKAKAKQKWLKLPITDDLFVKIIKALETQIEYSWRDKDIEFIPHPITWLNQERWEDEIKPTKKEWLSAEQRGAPVL